MSTTSFIESFEELRALTDDQIKQRINDQLRGGHVMLQVSFLNDELWRRESGRREQRMVDLTRTIEQLTWVVTASTIGALVFALVALLFPRS